MKVGIIGFGRFGSLLTRMFSEDFPVLVYDREAKEEEIEAAGGETSTFEQVCEADIVIPCVPISGFEEVIRKMSRSLAPGNAVMDVCSVKEYPARIMQELLPEKTQILATHPLFGPDSAADSVKGHKIVLCRLRMDDGKYEDIMNYFAGKGMEIFEMTPEEHDREIARTQLITHLIGRSLNEYGASQSVIATEGYKRLLRILEVVENDTWKLYRDMNKYNRFANEAIEGFIRASEEIHRKVKE